jgi:hypothetical protein
MANHKDKLIKKHIINIIFCMKKCHKNDIVFLKKIKIKVKIDQYKTLYNLWNQRS